MDQGRFREGKTVRRSTSGTRSLDPQGTWPEQGAYQKAGVAAAVRTGDRGLQGQGPGLAIAHRRGFAEDQQDQVRLPCNYISTSRPREGGDPYPPALVESSASCHTSLNDKGRRL